MLQPFMHYLSTKRIVLASASPRRKQILENIGLTVEVKPSHFEENLDKTLFSHPYDYVKETAYLKTLSVAQRLASEPNPPAFVIGADTVVTLDDKIFEKPADKDDAFHMLTQFSGRTHSVYSGVVLIAPKPESSGGDDKFLVDQFYARTEVEFEMLSPETIRAYIDTGEPMDKAGGYGIQALGGTLIKGIHGCYFNVMGFPVNLFAKHFVELLQKLDKFSCDSS